MIPRPNIAKTPNRKQQKVGFWYADRFIQSAKKVATQCSECGIVFWLPPSKHGKYLTCGNECAATRRKRLVLLRERNCQTCGDSFIPRPNQVRMGHGLFCSQKCNTKIRETAYLPAAIQKRVETWKRNFSTGLIIVRSGANHHQWKGGKRATLKRRIENGKAAETNRRYRKNNKEKVREFAQTRKNRKIGRLPRGTIPFLLKMQKGRCAVCRCVLPDNYHVDHIKSLAKGGEHIKINVQLLCPTCNMEKSAKDPIDFMQSRGFLL